MLERFSGNVSVIGCDKYVTVTFEHGDKSVTVTFEHCDIFVTVTNPSCDKYVTVTNMSRSRSGRTNRERRVESLTCQLPKIYELTCKLPWAYRRAAKNVNIFTVYAQQNVTIIALKIYTQLTCELPWNRLWPVLHWLENRFQPVSITLLTMTAI